MGLSGDPAGPPILTDRAVRNSIGHGPAVIRTHGSHRSDPPGRVAIGGQEATNDCASALFAVNLQRRADAHRSLAHTHQPVGVEPSGLTVRKSLAVISHLERGRFAVTAPAHGRSACLRVTLDVHERFLRDSPHLALLQDRQAGSASIAVDTHIEVGSVRQSGRELLEYISYLQPFGDVGPEVVQGVSNLADDPTEISTELVERGAQFIPGQVAIDDAIELESQIGK